MMRWVKPEKFEHVHANKQDGCSLRIPFVDAFRRYCLFLCDCIDNLYCGVCVYIEAPVNLFIISSLVWPNSLSLEL